MRHRTINHSRYNHGLRRDGFVPADDDFWLTFTAPNVEVKINQRFLEQAPSAIQNKLLCALDPNLGKKKKKKKKVLQTIPNKV